MSASFRRGTWAGLLAAACVAAQGCGPPDPMEMTVEADNTISFSMWQSRARDRLGAERMADFNEAVQELRFRTMADSDGAGSEAVEEGTRAVIDGRTVRYVLELGLGWELSQLKLERSQLDFAMRQNATMRVRPGDTDSSEYLYELRQRHEARMKEASDKIDALQRKLVALRLHPGNEGEAKSPSPGPSDPPAAPLPMESPPRPLGCGPSKTQTPAET